MSVFVENVELFKDQHFTESWNPPFNMYGFKVEIKDGKARVYGNPPFGQHERSRFVKLTSFGEDVHGYKLKVNGRFVYFRADVLKDKLK